MSRTVNLKYQYISIELYLKWTEGSEISSSLKRNKVVITATQHRHNSWVMLELLCSLTTVRCQSKQCDGKYSGPLHPSHNTVVMSQLQLGLPAAVVWWEVCGSVVVLLCAGAAFFSADGHLTQRNAELGGATLHSNKGRFQHIYTSAVLYVSC